MDDPYQTFLFTDRDVNSIGFGPQCVLQARRFGSHIAIQTATVRETEHCLSDMEWFMKYTYMSIHDTEVFINQLQAMVRAARAYQDRNEACRYG